MMKLQAICFDFDGVIADSEPLHYAAFLEVLKPKGINFDYARYLAQYVGFDDRDLFDHVLQEREEKIDDQGRSELVDEKSDAFQQIIAKGVRTYPGVVELIEQAAETLKVALVSGALRSDIDSILARVNDGQVINRFATVVTADRVSRSKPDPMSYALAAEEMGVDPAGCLAIEDTASGIASAKGAGMRVLAVTNTHAADHLTAADAVTDSLADWTVQRLADWFADLA